MRSRSYVLMAGLASLVALAGIAFRGGAGGETLNPFTQVGRFKTETVYFRLVVDLTFDKAPVTVDVVVACGQHRTQSRAHGGTNETLGMSAFVYAVRLPGDHAVKVRTVGVPGAPNPCSGDTTANGRVPKNWLPLVVWYERADELAHGLGYADQDAYASPIARLGFRGARVETANAEDFERFLQTGPKNLVPPYLSQGMCCQGIPFLSQGEPVPPEYLARPEKAWRFAGTPECRGVRRVRLSESQRETIRALWPKERPDRWQPPAEGEYDLMQSISQNTPRGGRPETYDPERGSSEPSSDDTVFPVLANDALQGLERDPGRAEAYAHHALVDETPSLRGFVFCDSDAPRVLVEAFLKRPPDSYGSEGRRTCRLGGMDVRVRSGGCSESWIVFERDEYAFFHYYSSGA